MSSVRNCQNCAMRMDAKGTVTQFSKNNEVEKKEEVDDSWRNCPSPDSPRKPVKSTAVVKYTTVQAPANFARLQCNTNLNLPPSNWLSSSAESYGLQNVPFHSSGFSSFCMAHMFPDCVGEVDVVSDAENIKNLLKIPYSKGPVSMMVHRIENTLLIDEFDIHKHLLRTAESEWKWLKKFFYEHVFQSLGDKEKVVVHKDKSRYALQQKSLVSKFLYHSLAVTEPGSPQKEDLQPADSMPVAEVWPPLPDPQFEEQLPDPLSNHKFTRNVLWTFEDIQMLIGTDMPIFGGTTHPCISLRLRDASKPINVLTGIDYWLDNLMCNVPELVMCYHLDGIVQKYELIKTEDLPHLENSKFSPKVIRDVAQNILSFLKSNATKAGHTYWLFKGKDADIVKLYDLTSLCSEVTDEKGQNPFTIPVAMLLYRVARNMKHSPDGQRQQGTIRMLLKNCLSLLPKEKYPQIVTSAHYMLSDLYIPADIDPAAPGLSEHLADERTCDSEDEEEDRDRDAENVDDGNDAHNSGSRSVAVKSLCLTTARRTGNDEGDGDSAGTAKYSPPPQSLPGGLEERCKFALVHVAAGLECLPFFNCASQTKEKGQEQSTPDEQLSGNEYKATKVEDSEKPKMAKPFEAIPMPYSPLTKNDQNTVDGSTASQNTQKKKKDSFQNKIPGIRSSSKHKDEGQHQKCDEEALSPKSLLCRLKAETMPTWQQPAATDNTFWRSHLRILLYEKARLVYATLAENEYSAERFGSTLRYTAAVLCCQNLLERLTGSSASPGLESYLLGRAGDACFRIVQDWTCVERHRQDFARRMEMDQIVLGGEMYLEELKPLPSEILSMEQMLATSCKCYQRALEVQAFQQQKHNLMRRLGNVHNELGVLYMNQAASLFQERRNPDDFEGLLAQSQHHLEQGVQAFEAVNDVANKALLLSNTGRLMRTCAHLYTPENRTVLSSEERYYYNKAIGYYQRAIHALGNAKSNPSIWHSVIWEMSTTVFTMASLLQDYPDLSTKTQEEVEREVVDFLQKALKYCDLETPGPRQLVYQFRAASIHHRLASLYHKCLRSLSADDAKRRNVLQLSRMHYEKASGLLLQLEHPSDFLRVQLERVALCEFLAEGTATVGGKVKHYQAALELMEQCLPILGIMTERMTSHNRELDSNLKTNSAAKTKAKSDVCEKRVQRQQQKTKSDVNSQIDEKNNDRNKESSEGVIVEEEDAERTEEQQLLKLLKERLQYVLLNLTKLHFSKTKKETEGQQANLCKNLYRRSLEKDGSDLLSQLTSILTEICSGQPGMNAAVR